MFREYILKKIFENRSNLFLKNYTFDDLLKRAEVIASNLKDEKNIAIIGEKSFDLYASILAVFMSKKTFIPISMLFSKDRIEEILNYTSTILVAKEAKEFIKKMNLKANIIYLDEISQKDNKLNIFSEYVYIMFTSGSTGKPKAIPINETNLKSYLDFVSSKFNITSKDILSQTFDISFDLSMHDIFVSFITGARLVPIPKEYLFMPNKIIKKNKISVFFAVPSVVIYMDKLKLLKDKCPSIRLTLFCGEALPVYIAKKWQECAINSKIYNLYGPTECTIAISYFKFDKNKKYPTSTVPIGEVFDNSSYKIIDNKLFICGDQVFDGYLNAKNRFIYIDGKKYYNTGDLVKESEYGLIYLGREDEQIKLNGYRIELGEIENKAREKGAVAVALYDSKKNEIVLFSDKEVELDLPGYMKPKKVIILKNLPVNKNGKFDKKKLREML